MEPLGQAIEAFINNLPNGSVQISYIKEKIGGKYTTMELIDAANYLIEKGLVFSNNNKDGKVYGLTDLGEQMRTT